MKKLPSFEEAELILSNKKGFFNSLNEEQKQIALNAPKEAETFGDNKDFICEKELAEKIAKQRIKEIPNIIRELYKEKKRLLLFLREMEFEKDK